MKPPLPRDARLDDATRYACPRCGGTLTVERWSVYRGIQQGKFECAYCEFQQQIDQRPPAEARVVEPLRQRQRDRLEKTLRTGGRPPCSVEGCGRLATEAGLCPGCRAIWRRAGGPDEDRPDGLAVPTAAWLARRSAEISRVDRPAPPANKQRSGPMPRKGPEFDDAKTAARWRNAGKPDVEAFKAAGCPTPKKWAAISRGEGPAPALARERRRRAKAVRQSGRSLQAVAADAFTTAFDRFELDPPVTTDHLLVGLIGHHLTVALADGRVLAQQPVG